MKTAFVLAGGGAAGSYQVGCLRAVLESGVIPDFMTANSAGSLNAAGLSFAGMDELEKVWRSVTKRSDIFGDKFLGFFDTLLGGTSLWTSKPLRKKLEILMDRRDPRIPFWVNYVDLKTGSLVRVPSSTIGFLKYVLASASIPVVTDPVEGYMVDGGIRENTPLNFAIQEGADRLFVFLNSAQEKELRLKPKEKFKDVREIATRAIEIMTDEMHWDDLHAAIDNNYNSQKKAIEIYWFAPKKEIIGTLDFKQEQIAAAIAQGYEESKQRLKDYGLL